LSRSLPWLVGAAMVVVVAGIGLLKWARTGSGQATLLALGSDKMFSEVQASMEEALSEALPGFESGPTGVTPPPVPGGEGGYDWPVPQLGAAAVVRCRTVPVSQDLTWWQVQLNLAEAAASRGGRILWAERLFAAGRSSPDRVQPSEERDMLRVDLGVKGRPTHTLVLYRAGRRPDLRWGGERGATGWSRLAEADGPVVALVIDDWGYSKSEAARTILSLPAPVTLAVLPGLPYSRYFALKGTDLILPGDGNRPRSAIAEGRGSSRRQRLDRGCLVEVSLGKPNRPVPNRRREILLHLPMEPQGYPDPDPGPKAVMVGMSEQDIGIRLDEAMAAMPMITGVNNHMGSAATSDPETMAALMKALRSRHLLFIDSLTSSASVAYAEAVKAGLPTAKNRIFLDYDNENQTTIKANLEVLVRTARSSGFALGIGHPHPATADVLAQEIPRLVAEGVRFVTVSEMLALRELERIQGAEG
jgi:polysaccharide deacetylase 2 family uncharacterized protein YibQ